jgi:hypothetical protein
MTAKKKAVKKPKSLLEIHGFSHQRGMTRLPAVPRSDSPSVACKNAGLQGLTELARRSGQSTQKLDTWFRDRPELFDLLLIAAATVKRIENGWLFASQYDIEDATEKAEELHEQLKQLSNND